MSFCKAQFSAIDSNSSSRLSGSPALTAAALDYIARGWALTWFDYGQKFPTHKAWNTAGEVITTPEAARRRWNGTPRNIGVVHGLGAVKTCSLDVDKVELTRAVLAEFGIDLDALRPGVPCVVGNPANFRLLYRQPPGMDLPKVDLKWPDREGKDKFNVFELRAGPNQDVLPPSLHPNGQLFRWAHPLPVDPADHPEPPPALLELWLNWSAWEPALKAACPWLPVAPEPAPPPHRPADGANLDIIGQFNAAHDVRNLLEANGYQPRGKNRYLPPNSTSGVPSVRILDSGRVFSSNGSCPLNDGHGHDAFGVFTLLEHGGEVRAAVKAAAALLGIELKTRPEPPPRSGPAPRGEPGCDDEQPTPANDGWQPKPLPESAFQEPAPYPMDALPAALQQAVAEMARFIQVPAGSPAVFCLATLATAIGKKALVVERYGLEHHPSFFWTVIAASGERKSPVCRLATRPLLAWMYAKDGDYQKEKAAASANHAAVNAKVAGIRKRAEKEDITREEIERQILEAERGRLPVPIPPRLFSSDPTEERLFQLMEERDGAYAVISGEGRPVADALMGKHSGAGRTGDSIYLAGITGDTITRDRIGKNGDAPESRFIEKPCLNVAIMLQPDKYLTLATCPALRESGAIARIWPVMMPSLMGERMETEDEAGLDRGALLRFETLVADLLCAERREPHRARLSPEAATARREFHNSIELALRGGGAYHDSRDIASKAVSQTVKLALVIQLAQRPLLLLGEESEIGLEAWEAAETLGRYHLDEAVRIQRTVQDGNLLAHAHKLLMWLKQTESLTITALEVQQFAPRDWRPNSARAFQLLDLLEAYGWVAATTPPGKRKPVYAVCPRLFAG